MINDEHEYKWINNMNIILGVQYTTIILPTFTLGIFIRENFGDSCILLYSRSCYFWILIQFLLGSKINHLGMSRWAARLVTVKSQNLKNSKFSVWSDTKIGISSLALGANSG